MSDEQKDKIRQTIIAKGLGFVKGYTPWNKGNITPKSVREKISKANKGKIISNASRTKISESRLKRKSELGYLNSPETRKRLSESHKGHIPWNKGKTNIYSAETKLYPTEPQFLELSPLPPQNSLV